VCLISFTVSCFFHPSYGIQCIHIYICINMHINIHTHVLVYVYIYIYIYIHTHTGVLVLDALPPTNARSDESHDGLHYFHHLARDSKIRKVHSIHHLLWYIQGISCIYRRWTCVLERMSFRSVYVRRRIMSFTICPSLSRSVLGHVNQLMRYSGS